MAQIFVIFKTITKWVFETNGMYYVSPSCEFGRGNVAVYNVAVLPTLASSEACKILMDIMLDKISLHLSCLLKESEMDLPVWKGNGNR